MNYAFIFSMSNALAGLSWIYLFIFRNKSFVRQHITYTVLLSLIVMYTYLILSTLSSFQPDQFNSLVSVKAMFTTDVAVLAGWIHYLAFDLFAGLYINEELHQRNTNWFITLPILLLTFMFGPAGLLCFIVYSQIKK